jgi:hypothetical protein
MNVIRGVQMQQIGAETWLRWTKVLKLASDAAR